MKLISLNTYGGHFFEPLMKFVKAHAATTDIFCFQEILDTPTSIKNSRGARANLYSEIAVALPEFRDIFSAAQEHYDTTGFTKEDIREGIAIFFKSAHKLHGQGEQFIYGERNSFVPGDLSTIPYNLQYVQLVNKKNPLTIVNLHGTYYPGNKLDTPERLTQSKTILKCVKELPGEKIITGDFNLLPKTRSVRMFEEQGFRNLVREFSIKTTRGRLVKKLHPEYGTQPGGWQEFADYTFITSRITPLSFTVPDLSISDHLPLIFEFSM